MTSRYPLDSTNAGGRGISDVDRSSSPESSSDWSNRDCLTFGCVPSASQGFGEAKKVTLAAPVTLGKGREQRVCASIRSEVHDSADTTVRKVENDPESTDKQECRRPEYRHTGVIGD